MEDPFRFTSLRERPGKSSARRRPGIRETSLKPCPEPPTVARQAGPRLECQRGGVGMSFANRRARNPGKCMDRSLPSTFVIISADVRFGSVNEPSRKQWLQYSVLALP